MSRLHNNLHKQQDNQMSSQVECTKEILIKSIVLKNVEYSYPNSDFNALSEINLKIDSGESIGFIGASGSGKTTLVDILLGLLIPKTGEVLLNDEPLNNSIRCWHDNIAYLPQQVFIIDNTLRANIALGEDENKIDQIKLNNAIKKANLCELVDQLPMGVDTVLGERGARLSGGQRQRVALARAFYYERDVLIMDESTSALDNETELEIIEEIKQLKGEKTIIVIAHRLTTVRYCDRIYKMEKGRIVNIGTPQEVLNEGY